MTEEHEYFNNKLPERTYVSKAFPSFLSGDNRKLRFISRVFDESELHEFVEQKGEIVLYVTPAERQEVKAMFYEDSREINCLTIQRFTRRTGKPHKKTSFTFSGESLEKIYKLLRVIKCLPLEKEEKDWLDDELLNELLISADEKERFFRDNIGLVKKFVESEITESDVVALAYRKKQLVIFEQLLKDEQYFKKTRQEWGKPGKESVWQQFFENNTWIFGYGLNYIFTSRLGDLRLEQTVAGFNLTQAGKRVDALMKTRGLISSLCFVEIKTHSTPLLKKQSYRSECWPVSDDLAGSVSQIQKTVQKAIKEINTKIELTTTCGDPTGETAFIYQPKSYIVIGSLDEFITDGGVNEQKFSSFELFRRCIVNTEIITFDELLERAKFIVQHSESEELLRSEGQLHPESEDDIPF